MRFPISNRALLQGMMASAVVLAGATACSRPDRNDTDGDNTAVVLPDTTGTEAAPSAGAGTTASGAATDTGTATGALGDTAAVRSDTPRASTAPAETGRDSVQRGNPEEPAAGYREMEGDSARVTADTSETSLNPADTAAVETAGAASDTSTAGYVAMARDTISTTPEQADTASAAGDVALKASVDTTHAEAEVAAEPELTTDTLVVAAGEVDSAVVSGDSAEAAKTEDRLEPVAASAEVNDTLTDVAEAEPVRPPEDSIEVLGNVTENGDAEEADVASEARAEVSTDEVGAAAIGGNVTGAEAVSLMTRQGIRCFVVDPESNESVRWDMASTPATLNPCGIGSMNLSKIWTRQEQ
ncbi:MAG TPA: hypothetical protein VFS51_09925 [Gemmatimonadales bacterium]|nr:hypothetical protein [Gemmatimonadales bacterium]